MVAPLFMEENMKKSYIFLCLIITFVFLYGAPHNVANASSNMDGGGTGGGTQSGSSQNYYTSGDDGVRITIIDATTKRRAGGTLTIDYFNRDKSGKSIIHFGKVCKIEYMGAAGYSSIVDLMQSDDDYLVNSDGKTVGYYMPEMPTIVSSSVGNSDIDEIKAYFNNETPLRAIAKRVGMTYDEMISGKYKLIIEPVIYLTYQGMYIAMTAHEAAKFDLLLGGSMTTGGDLRAKFVSFTHKNLPLSIFLKTQDLGIHRWIGSKYNRVNNGDILNYLGIGILSFYNPDDPFEIDADLEVKSFTYRPDTDVITSVDVSAGSNGDGATGDNPITVQFRGDLITTTEVSGIVIPAGGSRPVWFKWHTPNVTEKTTSYIDVSVIAGDGNVNGRIKIQISPIAEKEPYNPTADDKKPYGWSDVYLPRIPNFPKTGALYSYTSPVTSLSWHTYTCTVRNEGTGEYYEDPSGNLIEYQRRVYDFTTNNYVAKLISSAAAIFPDTNTKPANKKSTEIKSGYGIEETVSSEIVTSSYQSAVTGMQTSVTYFPEFFYKTYRRIGKLPGADLRSTIQFPVSQYSIRKNRIHFLPIWYPDTEYKVYIEVLDAWTPAGMLCYNTTASIQVKGSMWDDWYIEIGDSD